MLNAPPIPLMEYKKSSVPEQRDAMLSAASTDDIPKEPGMQYGMNLSAADR